MVSSDEILACYGVYLASVHTASVTFNARFSHREPSAKLIRPQFL